MSNKPQFVGEKVRLGDCFPYIKNGYNVRQGKDKGGIPITRIETLSDNQFNRDKVGYADIFSTEGLENRILEDGDILMSHINSLPYLGRSVMYRARPCEVIIHGMNLLRLKADRSIVEPEYAELYFRSPHFKQQVLTIAKKAVNQASFSVNNLKELEFPLMSLCDQRDAIEKLSSISAQIEYCQRVIGKLDQLVKSRFVEMFGDPDSNPHRLEVCPLGKVLSVQPSNGLYKPQKDYVSDGSGTPIIRIDSFRSEGPDYGSLKRLNCNESECRRYGINENDIVINRVNSVGCMGKTMLVSHIPEVTVFESNMMRLHSDDALMIPAFLCIQMTSEFSKSYFEANAKRAIGQASINQKDVKGLPVLVPEIGNQKAYLSFVSQVDKSRFVAQKQVEKLQMLYDSLAQEYFGD